MYHKYYIIGKTMIYVYYTEMINSAMSKLCYGLFIKVVHLLYQ